MTKVFTGLLVFCSLIAQQANAQSIDGTWKYTGAKEYFGDSELIVPLKLDNIKILNGKVAISPSCVTSIRPEPYHFSMNFQSLLRQKINAEEVNKYFKKQLSFPLDSVKVVYKTDIIDCSKYFDKVFIEGNRMVVAYQTTTFYTFSRVEGPAHQSNAGMPSLKQKITPLPFDLPSYTSLCESRFKNEGGRPNVSSCAPDYYPYVASKGSGDLIVDIIGNHNYTSFRDDGNGDYDQPFAKGLHPVYLVLPPLKDTIIVRVDDVEANGDDREPFGGAFLTIRDGKVIDQLNEGCTMNAKYICVNRSGKPLAWVLPSGKFQRN